MKRTIRDLDIYNKRVIIRVDFNVPIKDNKILDDYRIKQSLETIKYAIDKGAKVILMSHLGRVKKEEDKKNNSLRIVSRRLSELLNKPVIFVNKTRGIELENKIYKLNSGEVLLMENTRFEDIDGKKESSNNMDLAHYWASLGDIFINDAFGTSHREHASNVGIANLLENGIGFLIEKELSNINSIIENPKRPFTVILGGSKVNDKIDVISNLVKKADNLLIGGAMAYTFLYAKGYNIGKSLLDSDSVNFCKQILYEYSYKILLPLDHVVSNPIRKIRKISNFEFDSNDVAFDIGKKTISKFKEILDSSQTILWNGPLGMFEDERFSRGTKEIAKYLNNSDKTVIIGGGDTSSAVINFGYKNYTHISTGGGASLQMLEGKPLPGIEIIQDK